MSQIFTNIYLHVSLSITIVYSPTCHSPPTSEFDTLTMTPPCSQLLDSNTDYLSNGLIPYSVAHTPPPMYQPAAYTSDMMACDVPCPPMFTRNHPFVDGGSPSAMMDGPLPITLHEQTPASGNSLTTNPILFYPDCHTDYNSAFLDASTAGSGSPPCFPFSEEFVRPPIKSKY